MKTLRFVAVLLLLISVSQAQPPSADWSHAFSSSADETLRLYRMASLLDGSLVACGMYQDSTQNPVEGGVVIRFDLDGTELFREYYTMDLCSDIAATADGGFVLGGDRNTTTITKYSPANVLEWSTTVNHYHNENVDIVRELPDGAFVMTVDGETGCQLYRFSSSGQLVGDSFISAFEPRSAEVLEDGLLLAGANYNPYYGSSKFRVVKVNFAGEQMWSHLNGGSENSAAYYVRELPDGTILSVGMFNLNLSALVRLRANGSRLMQYQLPISGWAFDWFRDLPDGTLMLAANMGPHYGDNTRWAILKSDYQMQFDWWRRYLPAYGESPVMGLDGGTVVINANRPDGTIVKFEPEVRVTVSGTPAVVPPGGGTVSIATELSNILLAETPVDVWVTVQDPDGNVDTYDPVQTTLLPGQDLTLADEMLAWTADDPAGMYRCFTHVGDFETDRIFGRGWLDVEKQTGTVPAGSEVGEVALPENMTLSAYPNPFNSATRIEITLPKAGETRVSVYNTGGQEVALLHTGYASAGTLQLSFDGSELSCGVYFVRAAASGASLTRKILLLK